MKLFWTSGAPQDEMYWTFIGKVCVEIHRKPHPQREWHMDLRHAGIYLRNHALETSDVDTAKKKALDITHKLVVDHLVVLDAVRLAIEADRESA